MSYSDEDEAPAMLCWSDTQSEIPSLSVVYHKTLNRKFESDFIFPANRSSSKCVLNITVLLCLVYVIRAERENVRQPETTAANRCFWLGTHKHSSRITQAKRASTAISSIPLEEEQ